MILLAASCCATAQTPAQTCELRGRVDFGSAVAGKAATSFPGAVSLKPLTPGASSGPTVWDEDRRSFTISHIVPGTYRIQVVAAPNLVTSLFLEGKEVPDELTIRQNIGPMEIRVNTETGSLEGTVKDQDGKPRAAVVLITDGRSLRPCKRVALMAILRFRLWIQDLIVPGMSKISRKQPGPSRHGRGKTPGRMW